MAKQVRNAHGQPSWEIDRPAERPLVYIGAGMRAEAAAILASSLESMGAEIIGAWWRLDTARLGHAGVAHERLMALARASVLVILAGGLEAASELGSAAIAGKPVVLVWAATDPDHAAAEECGAASAPNVTRIDDCDPESIAAAINAALGSVQ